MSRKADRTSLSNPAGYAPRVRKSHRLPLPAMLLSVCSVILSGGATLAQTNLETNAGIQFNFSTPGAGNLALGGAFLALADDATTAYTNPAGLTNLSVPEAAAELRSWSYTHRFTDRGRLEGREPTGNGIDTIAGLRDGEAENRVTGLSFLSYAHPRRRWAFALYRHQLADFAANFSTAGAFLEQTRSRSPIGFPIITDGRLASLENTMDLEITNHGISAAYRLTSSLSAGVSLSHYDFHLVSEARRFLPPPFDSPEFSDVSRFVSLQTQSGEDSDWGLTIGLLWNGAKWSAAGVYRQGPSFGFDARSLPGPGASEIFPVTSDQKARFHVPDVIGFGIAFKPTDRIRIAFDYNRVEYSDLIDDMVDIFNVGELFGLDPELNQFRIDDVDELHLGFEYAFLRLRPGTPIFVRLGAWHDPDHSLRFEGDNEALRGVYRRRGDDVHFSAGVGISRGRFQLDVAFDYSERISTTSLSTIYRF